MTTTTSTTDALVYDPDDRDTIMNPHPLFRRMREVAPLYHREEQDFWAVSRFEDVKDVLLNREPSLRIGASRWRSFDLGWSSREH